MTKTKQKPQNKQKSPKQNKPQQTSINEVTPYKTKKIQQNLNCFAQPLRCKTSLWHQVWLSESATLRSNEFKSKLKMNRAITKPFIRKSDLRIAEATQITRKLLPMG